MYVPTPEMVKQFIYRVRSIEGRARIVDNKAIIGSIDLDSYSLTGPRIEFAVYTEDVEIVRKLRSYFKQKFNYWGNSLSSRSRRITTSSKY